MKKYKQWFLFDVDEYENYLRGFCCKREIKYIHLHHFWKPSYKSFRGNNHFRLQEARYNYYRNKLHWSDIADHVSTYPDGLLLTGRTLNRNPASIKFKNRGAFAIENLGNFDDGFDSMTQEQQNAIVKLVAVVADIFSVPLDSDHIVYHAWFNRETGKKFGLEEMNNSNEFFKSCPGSNFFGGNSIKSMEENFLPLVRKI